MADTIRFMEVSGITPQRHNRKKEIMISRSEKKIFLKNEPQFADIMCSLRATGKQPRGIINETEKVMALARKFNDEVARPYTLELDQKW